MSAPSLTLKSVQNEETGTDISVPRFQEEEAPLGGISVLYEIAVVTKLDLFKTRLHRNEDVVQFSVYKAYREVEDLYNKLNKKYPKAGLPLLPKNSRSDKYTNEDKVAALDRFMQAVGKNIELCHSSIFTHFIGINSQRLPSFTVPNINMSSNIDSTTKSSPESEEKGESEDLSEVFQKVKNVTTKVESKAADLSQTKNGIDLFEEVKIGKESERDSDFRKGTSGGGLFDDLDDDSLFSSTVAPKSAPPPKQENKVVDVKPRKKEPEKKQEVVIIDDSDIIIKERKLGNISLFDEQDLGDHITKDEEALFLVSSNDNEKNKKNNLLFSSRPETDELDSGLNENLEDLLNLNPLPPSPALKKLTSEKHVENKSEDESFIDISTTENQPKRPVPLPRKKSVGTCDNNEQNNMTRPEVMPRKVFLTKPEVPTKPTTIIRDASKPVKPPPIKAKPVLPNKPKPPPKPSAEKNSKDLDVINANESTTLENQTSVSSLTDDLNKLDILKYIEQEQKTLESEPSLFD